MTKDEEKQQAYADRERLVSIAVFFSQRARQRVLSHAARREAEDRMHAALDEVAKWKLPA